MHRQPWRLLHSLHRTEAQRAHRSKLLPNASILIRYGYHLAALKRKAFASSKGSHRCCMHEKEKQQHQRRRRRLPCMGCPLGKSSRKHNCTSDKRNNKKKQKHPVGLFGPKRALLYSKMERKLKITSNASMHRRLHVFAAFCFPLLCAVVAVCNNGCIFAHSKRRYEGVMRMSGFGLLPIGIALRVTWRLSQWAHRIIVTDYG